MINLTLRFTLMPMDSAPNKSLTLNQGRDTFTHPKLRELSPRQLSFRAMENGEPLLVKHFGDAVDTLRNGIGNSFSKNMPEKVDGVIDLAVRLLGAIHTRRYRGTR